ncbi:hypothetical protein [Lebetimonas sp. JH292]|uniref:hypothetical protein n=1 Tax=Lebetimonas sp. JH292 TaxID=990068 RepID=UPI0004650B5C|nr:hypothetical protein [Lebetimonas sp. JH292]
MNFATVEGTFSYIKKFPKYSKDFYNFNGDFFISSLGLGSFRKEPGKLSKAAAYTDIRKVKKR